MPLRFFVRRSKNYRRNTGSKSYLHCPNPYPALMGQGVAMKRASTLTLLALLIAALSACAPRFDPDRSAQRFFDKGRDQILRSLEERNATPAQLDQARAVLERHNPAVPKEIAAMFREHRALLREITGGKDSSTLLAQEGRFHERHVAAVRSIGRMHEEIESAVGKPLWSAAAADMQERMARYFRD
jgi:hypothetical protein